MKTLKNLFGSLLMAALLFTSCDNDNDPTNNVCEDFYAQNFIVSAFSTANGYDDLPEYMDAGIQEYDIKINADGEICSIGYPNPSTYVGGTYIMEVINQRSGASYSGNHIFTVGPNLDYQPITPNCI